MLVSLGFEVSSLCFAHDYPGFKKSGYYLEFSGRNQIQIHAKTLSRFLNHLIGRDDEKSRHNCKWIIYRTYIGRIQDMNFKVSDMCTGRKQRLVHPSPPSAPRTPLYCRQNHIPTQSIIPRHSQKNLLTRAAHYL